MDEDRRADGGRAVTGSRRGFLMAAGTVAGGLNTYPGGAAGRPEAGITVGEGDPTLTEVTAAFGRENGDIVVETIEAGGFEALLGGEADLQHATRLMTAAERERARENGIEFELRELPLGGVAALGSADGWCRCLPEGTLEGFGRENRVEVWSEVVSGVPDGSASADLPRAGADVLVRGTRSHQYAIGYGGVGYHEATPSAFESVGESRGAAPVVRLGFVYVDRDALERGAVAALVERQTAAASDVEHVPVTD